MRNKTACENILKLKYENMWDAALLCQQCYWLGIPEALAWACITLGEPHRYFPDWTQCCV